MKTLVSLFARRDENERIEISRAPVANSFGPNRYVARTRGIAVTITEEERDALLARGIADEVD